MAKRGEIFKSVSGGKKIRTNVFDLSHEKKLSANMADLVPIYLQECVPGDKFKGSTEMVIRLAPMIAPIMHRVNAYVHYFFVPNRLVWSNWEKFITGGTTGDEQPSFPCFNYTSQVWDKMQVGSLSDYFGIPPAPAQPSPDISLKINLLPYKAYAQVYNDYYRDQTLTPEVNIFKDIDGELATLEQVSEILKIRKRQWEKDYFTSALPWTQRSSNNVLIPMDVNYKTPAILTTPLGTGENGALEAGTSPVGGIGVTGATKQSYIDNIESLEATINDLRTSITLQQWLEKNARAGARYIEQILAHFQRRVPDYRLQRSEMIGGGKQTVMISEVLSSFENAETAQGKLAGHGISVGNASGFKYTADEHGYIIGILSVIPRTCYYSGIHRMWFKENKFDFYFPEFAHLGEQPVYNKEIYTEFDADSGNQIFGYQSRYAEYKYIPDSVHGEFRTNLEYWHLGRKFTELPFLNNSFTECNPDTRIFAVQDESTQKLWIQLYNNIRAIRPMPVYGTPIL